MRASEMRNSDLKRGFRLAALAFMLALAAGEGQAQLQAMRCATAMQDFGNGPRQTALPPEMGTVTDAVAERWVVTSPTDARSGWWPNTGGDHTNPGNGYFLLMDIRTNRQGQPLYTNTLTGLQVGQSYSVSLWLASAHPGLLPQVTVDLPGTGQALELNTTAPASGPDALTWQEARLTFTATAPTQTLSVLERRAFTGGSGNDLTLDDISLTHNCSTPAVNPVPASGPFGWLLATGGIVGFAIARRLRRTGKSPRLES